jgi:hypothetical protein
MINIKLSQDRIMKIIQFIDQMIHFEIKTVPKEMQRHAILNCRDDIMKIWERRRVSIKV